MQLEPADIVLVHGRGWFSRLIRALERSPGEAKSWASHVALSIGDGWVVEALPHGVVSHLMPYAPTRVQVWRPLGLTDAEKRRIVRHGLGYVGHRYGWTKLALHALGLQRLAFYDGTPICSWVVARPYTSVGLTFGVAANEATPDDIHDFVLRHEGSRYGRVRAA